MAAYPHMIFATEKADLTKDRLVEVVTGALQGAGDVETEQTALKVVVTTGGYPFTFWFEDADRVGEMYADYLPEGARRRPVINATTVLDMSGAADPSGEHAATASTIVRTIAGLDGVHAFSEECKRFVGLDYGDGEVEELLVPAAPAATDAPSSDDVPVAQPDETPAPAAPSAEEPALPAADQATGESVTAEASEAEKPVEGGKPNEGRVAADVAPHPAEQPTHELPQPVEPTEPDVVGDEPAIPAAQESAEAPDTPAGPQTSAQPSPADPETPAQPDTPVQPSTSAPATDRPTVPPAAAADHLPPVAPPASSFPAEAPAPAAAAPGVPGVPAPAQSAAPAEQPTTPDVPSTQEVPSMPEVESTPQAPAAASAGGATVSFGAEEPVVVPDEQPTTEPAATPEPAVTPEPATTPEPAPAQEPVPTAEPQAAPIEPPAPIDAPAPIPAPSPEPEGGFFKRLFGRRK